MVCLQILWCEIWTCRGGSTPGDGRAFLFVFLGSPFWSFYPLQHWGQNQPVDKQRISINTELLLSYFCFLFWNLFTMYTSNAWLFQYQLSINLNGYLDEGLNNPTFFESRQSTLIKWRFLLSWQNSRFSSKQKSPTNIGFLRDGAEPLYLLRGCTAKHSSESLGCEMHFRLSEECLSFLRQLFRWSSWDSSIFLFCLPNRGKNMSKIGKCIKRTIQNNALYKYSEVTETHNWYIYNSTNASITTISYTVSYSYLTSHLHSIYNNDQMTIILIHLKPKLTAYLLHMTQTSWNGFPIPFDYYEW